MPSSSSSSASSSSSPSSRSSSPEPQPKSKVLKRKHGVEDAQSSSDSSSDDSDDSSSEDEQPVETLRKKKKNTKATPPGGDAEPAKEEPVLSHAERRRQKRLAKQKAAAGDDDAEAAPKKRKLADGSASTSKEDKPKARQNSVWVGNMSFKTTQDDLKRFFGECGEITRVNMPTKPRSRPNVPLENRGFAYVDFATPEAKAAAIALSEQNLVGRKLLIKDGDSFEGRPAVPGADLKTTDPSLAHRIHSKTAQKILRQQKQPPAPTLFIGNLPFETTEEGLKELFEKHHEQETKRASGKSGKKSQNGKAKKGDDDGSDDEGGKGDKADDKETDEEKDDEGKAQEKAKGKATSKKDEFILRVRMGTFEDSGACKGFSFIDFSSIDNATSALINIKNHFFNGRELKVEYAGIDAVRRGAAKHLVPAAADGKGGKGKSEGGKPFKPRGPKPPRQPYHEKEVTHDEGAMDVDEPVSAPPVREGKPPRGDRPPKRDFDDKRKGPRARPTPGAALALAKRETAAIMPSQGKKTTF